MSAQAGRSADTQPRISVCDSLADLNAGDWDALVPDGNPFLSHAFLLALERHGAVGPGFGWLPRFLLARDAGGQLVGAVPLYEKDNSYGEFVFDWAWADALERAGRSYYPKLVAAVPYTPATGPRLLVHPAADYPSVARALWHAVLELARSRGVSSVHWLFTDERDTAMLIKQGLLLRQGTQFHWHNRGYRNFDDFLATLSSKKRKNIRRERRLVQEQGVRMEVLHGHEVSDDQWRIWHRFYRSTFERKSGIPTLSEGFFREIGQALGEAVILVMACHGGHAVAAALMLKSAHTLYGRHWGCEAAFDGLHFEACYYQGIDYAIGHGLERFEPGAQGEYKVSRGFMPTSTWSAHWIRDEDFREVIARFVAHEQVMVDQYMQDLCASLPYRRDTA